MEGEEETGHGSRERRKMQNMERRGRAGGRQRHSGDVNGRGEGRVGDLGRSEWID